MILQGTSSSPPCDQIPTRIIWYPNLIRRNSEIVEAEQPGKKRRDPDPRKQLSMHCHSLFVRTLCSRLIFKDVKIEEWGLSENAIVWSVLPWTPNIPSLCFAFWSGDVGYGSRVEIWAWVIRSCGHALLKICEISPSVVLHPTILYLNIATLSSLFEGVGIQFMPTVSTALTVETVLTLNGRSSIFSERTTNLIYRI